MANSSTCLMDLPTEMIDEILSYLSFDQIAKLRVVNRTFNNICSNRLNNGFTALEKFHSKCMKSVKSKLPRRESERKLHPLARHCDILMAVETRFSMLSMTFSKYIGSHHCCFIPGKVLDEAFRVLRIVNHSSSLCSKNLQYSNLPRPYEILQEYRDISSMAMEHFEEKILPTIREKMRSENPLLYYYKSKLNRGQLLRVNLVKAVNPQSSSEKHATNSCPHGPDNSGSLSKDIASSMKLISVLRDTVEKCNSARTTVEVLQRNMTKDTNKIRIENIMLKRKCNQLGSVTKILWNRLAEMKTAVSTLTEDLNQLKSQQIHSSAVNSSSEVVSDPGVKLYKLLRHTNVKCNATHRTVLSLHRNMKIMAKRIRNQESLLRRTLSRRVHTTKQKRRELRSSTSANGEVNQMPDEPSCSKGVKRKLMATEETDIQS